MPGKWRRLHSSQRDLPPLLFKYSWTRQGYALYVTDLTSIWAEQLSKAQILKRADEIATTIDPSEDLEQLDMLLAKIGEALDGVTGSVSIHAGSQADSIEMVTSSKLPAPLKPLKWSFYGLKQPATSLTEQILLPLLEDEASRESRERFLLDQIKQKDWVLGKLFDKIESLSVDLGAIFPSASRRRNAQNAITKDEVAKCVNGVAPFDRSAWLAESGEPSADNTDLAANLVEAIIGPGPQKSIGELQPSQQGWWHVLQQREDSVPEDEKNDEGDMDLDVSTASEDEEFERQETPPNLKPQQPVPEPIDRPKASVSLRSKATAEPSPRPLVQDLGDSTASESDIDLESKSGISPPKTRRAKPESISPRPSDSQAGESTASESEGEPSPEPKSEPPRKSMSTVSPLTPTKPPTQHSEEKVPPKKLKGTLGVIGGKKTEEAVPPSPQKEPASPDASADYPKMSGPATSQSPATAKKPVKMGLIGGKAKTKASDRTEAASTPQLQPSSSKDDDSLASTDKVESSAAVPSRPSSKEEKHAVPVAEKLDDSSMALEPETEDQKADRKREELKRQLAEKSKVPKKKRKF
ncbi:XLF/Cernunnos protein [Penicillium chermesinum]|uniref:Non-homologous end-joining factor 1 n=1 Tax=Penicillium chermesinum TaxID=63820 RepID=A0A9W9NZ05_9EURO|nr:XLF/Cernunnos protein [Penicillium chermesinum]KAJ5232226.1 XLF/Cernunnos protein [Penicillium chermesinum]